MTAQAIPAHRAPLVVAHCRAAPAARGAGRAATTIARDDFRPTFAAGRRAETRPAIACPTRRVGHRPTRKRRTTSRRANRLSAGRLDRPAPPLAQGEERSTDEATDPSRPPARLRPTIARGARNRSRASGPSAARSTTTVRFFPSASSSRCWRRARTRRCRPPQRVHRPPPRRGRTAPPRRASARTRTMRRPSPTRSRSTSAGSK